MIDAAPGVANPTCDPATKLLAAQLERLLGALLTRAVRCVTSPLLSEDGELACALCDREGRTVLERGGHPVLVGALGAQVRALLADDAARAALGADEVVLSNASSSPIPMREAGELAITATSPACGMLDRRSYVLVVALPGGGQAPELYLALGVRFPRTPFAVPTDRRGFFQPEDQPEDDSGLAALPPAVGPRYLPFAAPRPAAPPLSQDDEGLALPPLAFIEARFAELGRRAGLRRAEQNDLIALRATLLHGKRSFLTLRQRTPEAASLAAALPAYTAAQATALWQQLPTGFYAFADSLDDDGCGTADIALRATLLLRKEDGGPACRLDLSDSADAVPGPLNLPAAATAAVVKEALLRLLHSHLAATPGEDRCLPRNDGLLAAVSLILRRGSLLAAEPPYALGLGIDETAGRLLDVLCGALAQAAPKLVGAASAGTRGALYLSSPRPSGSSPSDGSVGSVGSDQRLLLPGGAGAGGTDAMRGSLTGDRLSSLEALERRAPVQVASLSRRVDSGGLGLRAGEPGWVRELTLLRPAVVTLAAERRRRPPYGLAGGGPGVPGRETLRRGRRTHSLPAKAVLDGQTGDSLISESPGGAGHGDAQRAAFFASLFGESS